MCEAGCCGKLEFEGNRAELRLTALADLSLLSQDIKHSPGNIKHIILY